MPPRPEEVWAAAMVSAALCAEVRHHDDGSSDSQYDLDIIRPGFPVAAAEVVAAADSASIELWKLMNGGDGRWLIRNLRGGWMVTVMATARYRRLRAELPALLAKLEEAGLTALPGAAGGAGLDRVARDLQVASAWQGDTSFPGSVYLSIELPSERSGGIVSESGDPLSKWLGEFLREPGQADVLSKLRRSGADQRHAFVLLPGFSTAPFPVTDILMRSDAALPSRAPDLPAEITHLWAVSTWNSGDGMRWAPEVGWRRFSRVAETS